MLNYNSQQIESILIKLYMIKDVKPDYNYSRTIGVYSDEKADKMVYEGIDDAIKLLRQLINVDV